MISMATMSLLPASLHSSAVAGVKSSKHQRFRDLLTSERKTIGFERGMVASSTEAPRSSSPSLTSLPTTIGERGRPANPLPTTRAGLLAFERARRPAIQQYRSLLFGSIRARIADLTALRREFRSGAISPANFLANRHGIVLSTYNYLSDLRYRRLFDTLDRIRNSPTAPLSLIR